MAGVYVHIPFCEKKCIYCDFYSVESTDGIGPFLASLHDEIGLYRGYGEMEPVETVFFGGGTPSLLSPGEIGGIMERVRSLFTIAPGAEVTLEANPGTVDREKLRGYRSAGINRLSFGVQSFHEDELKFLGRIHSAVDAADCVRQARMAGFASVSVDLMFSLPGQTPERWKSTLLRAVDLSTQHISAYSLIVEEHTPLERMVRSRQIAPLPPEKDAELYELTMETMAANGFEQYEVSNFCKPGFRSRHNANYWNRSNYLGFGPSAHSFWSDRRWWNVSSVRGYVERLGRGAAPVAGSEVLGRAEVLDERVLLGLRSGGVDLAFLGEEMLRSRLPAVERFVAEGLAVLEDSTFRLTSRGFLLCDEISRRLLAGA